MARLSRRGFLLAAGALALAPAARAAASTGDDWLVRPITPEYPRVWPAVSRDGPLLLGAVEAFRAPERASEAGVRWGRVLFDWSAIQRQGPHQWDLGWLDESMARRERDAGRPVVGVLMSTPSWASGTRDPKSPPLNLDAPLDDPRNVWATYIRSLVGRFSGLVDTWVVWNEPDVWHDENHARQWDGTPEQYYQLLKVAYLSARRANPRATVLMAGMTYWWDAQYRREQYFSRVLRAAAADPTAAANSWYFDGAVLQLYTNPRSLFDAPQLFRQIMRQYGMATPKPVWVNETNAVPWDDEAAPLTRDHFRVTLDEQASYLVQAVAYALASGVERLGVYKMLDDAPIKRGVEQAFGMVRADAGHTTRPVFDAFRMLVREVAPTTRAQLVDEGTVNRVYLEQPSLGRRVTVLWTTGPQPVEVLHRALGSTVTAMDKLGRVRPLEVRADGRVPLRLAPATANTIPGHPDVYYVGGDPLLLLEPLPPDYRPLEPTYASLPPDLRPVGWQPAPPPRVEPPADPDSGAEPAAGAEPASAPPAGSPADPEPEPEPPAGPGGAAAEPDRQAEAGMGGAAADGEE